MKRRIILNMAGCFIFSIVSLSSAMMYGGGESKGGGHNSHQQLAQAESPAQEIASALGGVDAGNKICPVSGEKVDEKLKATYQYEGKIYNFCCAMCIDDFKKDPKKYIAKIEKQNPKSPQGEYQDTPGPQASGRLENGIRIIEVKASKYRFEPDPIVVKKGDKVRLIAATKDIDHGLAIVEFKVNLVISSGKTSTFEFIADKEGTFPMYCSVYCGPGHGKMRGSFIVK